MTDVDIKYMTEAMSADLAELLSKDYNLGIAEALEALYNSETYSKLIDSTSGLYFQSTLYVYSFLKNEIEKGRMA